MTALRRLDVRLFVSYVLVVLAGAATFTVTFLLLAPAVFDDRMGDMSDMHANTMGGTARSSHDAFVHALWVALPVSVLVSVLVAAGVAAFVARRILAPIEAVRHATARLGAGHYDNRVERPDEPELAALADDVNRLAAALEATETRRARLIGEVAHEMRTPITTIDGYVEGILDGVFEPDEETLTAIAEETARLTRLAADLAALSRAEEGAIELEMVGTDLAELARTVARRLQPQFESKQVHLEVTCDEPLAVVADEQRTRQILTNLIGNALTYTPAEGRVIVRGARRNGNAIIEVADTGAGLAVEDLDRVFERFYRVAGHDRPAGGSGIGLTIARSLARAQGGEVSAASPGRGRGSIFTLTFPVRPPPA